MSPSKAFEVKKEINGTRPSPLQISKGSHLIQKQSTRNLLQPQQQRQQRNPVIIYTYSPKVIHTNAHDFMSLVQKLTGLSQSGDKPMQTQSSKGNNGAMNDEMASCSDVTEENYGGVSEEHVNSSSYFSDIPLFTPKSSDFFYSLPSCRYGDPLLTPTNMSNSLSPSFLEILKGFQDYSN